MHFAYLRAQAQATRGHVRIQARQLLWLSLQQTGSSPPHPGQGTKADLDVLRVADDIDFAYLYDTFVAGLVLVFLAADMVVPCCADGGLWLVAALTAWCTDQALGCAV